MRRGGRKTPEEWEKGEAPRASEEPFVEERELLFVGRAQEAFEISLLLASQSRTHWLENLGDQEAIYVPLGRKRIEERLIRAWYRENSGFFSQVKAAMPKLSAAPLILITPPIALFFYERLAHHTVDWRSAGLADATKMVSGGEWHRAITALSLHGDAGHIASNSFWSFLLLTLLQQRIAWPFALWLTFFSGIFGNITSASLHTGGHRSLGFSTALFGAIGLLSGIEFRHPFQLSNRLLRRLAPLAGALFLGIWIGTGEGTDVTAHLTGLLWGLFFGFLLPEKALLPHAVPRPAEALTLSLLLWVVWGAAWIVALQ